MNTESLLFTLMVGSYTFTYTVLRWTMNKFDRILSNHIRHLEVRVHRLEEKHEADDEW